MLLAEALQKKKQPLRHDAPAAQNRRNAGAPGEVRSAKRTSQTSAACYPHAFAAVSRPTPASETRHGASVTVLNLEIQIEV